jgi:phenylalanyl-tRNA synthetase beta chain
MLLSDLKEELIHNITQYALKRAALLIQEVAGGEITSDIIDVYPKKLKILVFSLNFDKVNKIIGQEITKRNDQENFSFFRY